MSELKACPFCGKAQLTDKERGDTLPYKKSMKRICDWCDCEAHNWNTRPIEDGLRAELAAAQAEGERLREYSGQVSNIRAGLSREVEAQIILDARKPLEYEVARLRAQLESAKTWMPQWAIDVIEAFGVTK